jgi:hypothetical protein
MIQRQLPDLDAGLFGLMQPLRRQADIVLRQCHFIQTHFTQTSTGSGNRDHPTSPVEKACPGYD